MKIKDIIPQYISYRQSLGEKFRTNAAGLRCFLKYAGEETAIGNLGLTVCTDFLYAPSGKVTANWFCKYTALKGCGLTRFLMSVQRYRSVSNSSMRMGHKAGDRL
ncbi:MAG: hypothetical protein LBK58_02735 [Prevotellaceae bacterium]|jgi:hypothetical protein|nr:hypothetical protein [Prevotellaceae bacterium]